MSITGTLKAKLHEMRMALCRMRASSQLYSSNIIPILEGEGQKISKFWGHTANKLMESKTDSSWFIHRYLVNNLLIKSFSQKVGNNQPSVTAGECLEQQKWGLPYIWPASIVQLRAAQHCEL